MFAAASFAVIFIAYHNGADSLFLVPAGDLSHGETGLPRQDIGPLAQLWEEGVVGP